MESSHSFAIFDGERYKNAMEEKEFEIGLKELLKKTYGSKRGYIYLEPEGREADFIAQLFFTSSSEYVPVHYELRSNGWIELHIEDNCLSDYNVSFREKLKEAIKENNDFESLKWQGEENCRFKYKPKAKTAEDVINGFNYLIDIFENIILRNKKTWENMIIDLTELLARKRNIILTGAPGVGKTYSTAALALRVLGKTADWSQHDEVMKEYNKLLPMIKGKDDKTHVEYKEAQIFFTTFHQSLDYEDFVEGLKPKLNKDGNIKYDVEDGIFKRACNAAKDKPVVLIIDEINRGNVSKIFGELITLIESDKRKGEGGEHPLSAILPYSKSQFSVPSNLYIIGTMNTTDRSAGNLDYALRRRFAFFTLQASKDALISYYKDKGDKALEEVAVRMFGNVKGFIEDNPVSGDHDIDDLMVGHSYFMAKTRQELVENMQYGVIPLIKEYINDGILNVSDTEWKATTKKWSKLEEVPLKKQEQSEQ